MMLGGKAGFLVRRSSSFWRRPCHQMIQRLKFSPTTTTRPDPTNNPTTRTIPATQDEASGAWTLLAALEKSIEAQGIHVAQIVSSLEVLLPRPDLDRVHHHPADETDAPHTNDPAFFAFLPHMSSASDIIMQQPSSLSSSSTTTTTTTTVVKREHIVEMLHATRHGRRIALSTLQALLTAATWHNQRLPSIVSLPPLTADKKLHVVGDLHGSLSDLEAVLSIAAEPHDDNVIIFNGDLADRGDHGVEVIAIVCSLILAYPNQVFVNRGNHEDVALSIAYGLALEIQHKYGPHAFATQLAPLLDNFFCSLPLATLIQDDALIVHAGPPPPGVSLGQVSRLERTSTSSQFSRTVRAKSTNKVQAHQSDETHDENNPHVIILEALLWSDPSIDEVKKTLKDNRKSKTWKPNKSRGAGFKFDENVIRDFLQEEGLFRMIRSHEPVHNGCVRYTIDGDKNCRNICSWEFFTVFSASRYPNKEGFNRGAILTLLPQKRHRIVRYDTEDDEPVMELSKVLSPIPSHTQQDQYTEQLHECGVDTMALRRSLSEAIASHRSQLEVSLEQRASLLGVDVRKLPFCDAVDVLVDVLHLDEEGLCQPGPRLALARALSKQCHVQTLPESIDLIHALDDCIAEQDGSNYLMHLTWLHTIFSLVDTDRDGAVSHAEWQTAVAHINATLPPDAGIDADETWQILDLDDDGYVTAAEWDSVLLDVALTNSR